MTKGFFSEMFKPESSLKLIPIVNWTVVALLCLMAWGASYTDIASFHIYVMCFLSFGLLLSLNFFYIEFQKQKEIDARNGDEAKDDADQDDGAADGKNKTD